MIIKKHDLKNDVIYELLIKRLMIMTKDREMSEDEYRYVSSGLGEKNFLVFGVGLEAALWRYANITGKTVFLEYKDSNIKEESSDIVRVKYDTVMTQAIDLLEEYRSGKTDRLEMKLPDEIRNTHWDAIFINSPAGYNNECPGRMQSIYEASRLANKNTDVYIYCYDRWVEDLYSKAMFSTIVADLRKLRHVRL